MIGSICQLSRSEFLILSRNKIIFKIFFSYTNDSLKVFLLVFLKRLPCICAIKCFVNTVFIGITGLIIHDLAASKGRARTIPVQLKGNAVESPVGRICISHIRIRVAATLHIIVVGNPIISTQAQVNSDSFAALFHLHGDRLGRTGIHGYGTHGDTVIGILPCLLVSIQGEHIRCIGTQTIQIDLHTQCACICKYTFTLRFG